MAEREVSDDELKEWARARGYGEIAEVLHAATVMYVDWEMDNEAWLVRMADGSLQLFKTSHGGLYPMELEELDEKIAETDDSLRSLRQIRERLERVQGTPIQEPD